MRNYGLIGQRLDYSFSKDFFSTKFQMEQIDASFENIELATISEVVSLFEKGVYDGFTVTIPYKESIIPFLDDLSEEAKAIGAVNVVAFEHGKKIGYNTDAFGFHQSIKPFLTNQHERALILGTGGAAKAVAYVLKSIGLDVFFVSRTPKSEKELSYDALNEHVLRACKVVVNCTPVGTFPAVDQCVNLPYEFLTVDHLCIDLIYNPSKTQFLTRAEKQGAAVLNGLSMLREQALKAWSIWNKSNK